MRDKWQVIIRKKNHPHIYKTFISKSDASKYAGEAERNIEKGLFVDMSEANQTRLKDVLERYRDNVTADKKGAKQESYKRNNIDPDKHMARLNHLGLKAEEHKMFGIAGQMEIARGKVSGYYIDRQIIKQKGSRRFNRRRFKRANERNFR